MEGKGGEVVTRYPYENVRMDHLLSRELAAFQKDRHFRRAFMPPIPGPRPISDIRESSIRS